MRPIKWKTVMAVLTRRLNNIWNVENMTYRNYEYIDGTQDKQYAKILEYFERGLAVMPHEYREYNQGYCDEAFRLAVHRKDLNYLFILLNFYKGRLPNMIWQIEAIEKSLENAETYVRKNR